MVYRSHLQYGKSLFFLSPHNQACFLPYSSWDTPRRHDVTRGDPAFGVVARTGGSAAGDASTDGVKACSPMHHVRYTCTGSAA